MSEYKMLRVINEKEIYRLVKAKSITHIQQKIKQGNPIKIFSSLQYIQFLKDNISRNPEFWGISLSKYISVSEEL